MGDLGKSQVSVCHEALREFILESREFTKLLGDIHPDGTRVKGAIEQRSRLYGIHDDKEFFRIITLQAAAIAADKGLVTDAVRLYHLAEEYDKVIALISQSLSDAIVSDATGFDSIRDRTSISDTETTSAESVTLASTMTNLYRGNAMYYTKIRSENLAACNSLMQAFDAKRLKERGSWTEALDAINRLGILPLTADGSVSYIRGAVQAFSTLPPVVSRIVGQLIMWCIQCIAKERESLQQGLFENDMRHSLYNQLLSMARDLMTFAGMVRYKLSPKLYQALACAAGDIGL
ncbi:hypothetical protein KEM56_004040 [Ascosphaera pollenicola]|nr:hypothetical protein KEM56_004040 [Ascosphaera pollenicola]